MIPISEDCQRFQERLADYIDRRLSPTEHRAVEDHLRSCQRCRGLLRIAEGKLDLLTRTEHSELSEAVLAQTSGAVCGAAQEGMGDYLEGTLPSIDRRLLEQHMEHCSSCKAVFETMRRIVPVLAEMSELDPGKSFARDVIRVTSHVPEASTDWLERLRRWWSDQLAKPIIQWEAAYVGALLLVATFGVPGSPLRAVPGNVASSFHQAALSLIPGNPLDLITNWIVSTGTTAWQSTGGRVIGAQEDLERDMNARMDRIEPHIAVFKNHAELFGDALRETDIVQGALRLGEMQRALQRMWRDVRRGDEPMPDEHSGAECRMKRPPSIVTS